MSQRRVLGWAAAAATLAIAGSAVADPYRVLWWDSTPDYGGQAPNTLRQEMSDYLTSFSGGSLFNSTYVGSETPGTLAAHLGANSYDVLVFDATSFTSTFSAADLTAVQNFYADNNRNLLLDGNLYVRSIDYNATSDFPGINGSTGGLTVNEVFSVASRGGGIMIGTDHVGFQVGANQILGSILQGAAFSGNVSPSTDGQFNGTELLNVKASVAANDLLSHYASIESQGVAPTGVFNDFLGNSVTLYSQLDIAGFVGGTKFSFIATSFAPGGGAVVITDPDPPPIAGGIPEPSTWAMLIMGFAGLGTALRRRRNRAHACA